MTNLIQPSEWQVDDPEMNCVSRNCQAVEPITSHSEYCFSIEEHSTLSMRSLPQAAESKSKTIEWVVLRSDRVIVQQVHPRPW
jgi:hypothetical protein